MFRRGLERGDYALIVIVRVFGDLGVPHDLLGEYALAVYDRADLAVAPAGVEAYAAAVHVAAYRLRIAVLGGHSVAEHDLEGALVHVGHEVRVKLARPARAVCVADGLVHRLAAADIHLEAALHPEQHLHQAVDVVTVGLGHVGSAVYEGVVHGHLSPGALNSQRQRPASILEKSVKKLSERDKAGVKLRRVCHRNLYAKVIHNYVSSFFVGNTQCFCIYRLSAFLNLSRRF